MARKRSNHRPPIEPFLREGTEYYATRYWHPTLKRQATRGLDTTNHATAVKICSDLREICEPPLCQLEDTNFSDSSIVERLAAMHPKAVEVYWGVRHPVTIAVLHYKNQKMDAQENARYERTLTCFRNAWLARKADADLWAVLMDQAEDIACKAKAFEEIRATLLLNFGEKSKQTKLHGWDLNLTESMTTLEMVKQLGEAYAKLKAKEA